MYFRCSLSLVPRCQKMALTRRAPNTRACCPHATGANTGEPHTRSPTTSPHPPARRHSMATRCHLKRRAEVSVSMAGSNSTSSKVDTLEIEPRAFRMRSGCDTTTPCAHGIIAVVNSHNHRPHRCPKAWLRAQDSSHPRGRWAEHTPKSEKMLAHPRTTNVSVASLASW